jgi:hypothetical protein
MLFFRFAQGLDGIFPLTRFRAGLRGFLVDKLDRLSVTGVLGAIFDDTVVLVQAPV